MNKFNRILMVGVLMCLVAVGALTFVQAQDATPSGTVQCDSDLILNLYIAERFFGFSQVRNQLSGMGVDTSTMVDLNTFDRGQYSPWFAMNTGAASPIWNDDQVNMLAGTWSMDDASLQSMITGGMDMSGMTSLTPLSVADETAECAQLRAELTRFFNIVAFQESTGALGMMNNGMGGSDMGGTPMGTTPSSGDMTPEATP